MSDHDVGANPWPGYVDALSTIIMVFIFLVILLGIVITALSQNIAREMAAAKSDARQARHELQQHIMQNYEQQQPASAAAAAAAAAAKVDDSRDERTEAGQKAARADTGTLVSGHQEALTADTKVEGSDKVAVLARKIPDPKQLAIVDTATPTDTLHKVRVDVSQAALTLVFDQGIRITPVASAEIKAFFDADPKLASTSKIEIWAFANASRGSISEARRTAYYRGLLVRNEMLTHGFSGERIVLKVTVSQREEDRDRVKVFAK